MAKESKKINLMFVVLIGIFLIVLGICGTILISKGIESKKENNTNTNQSAQETKTLGSADDRYKAYSENLVKKIKEYKDSEKDPSGETVSPYMCIQIRGTYFKQAKIQEAMITPEGDLVIIQNGKEKKAKSNVISCYELESGNGGETVIMCINSDGTVSSINSEKLIGKSEIVIKDYSDVKNIVSLTTVSYPSAVKVCGIDIDGNIIPLEK